MRSLGYRSSISLAIAAIVIGLVVAACGSDRGAEQATTDSPPSTASSGSVSSTSLAAGREVELKTFEVMGAEVRVVTALDELPERASTLRWSGTIIDAGAGPNLCLGGVNLSMPPQCGGVIVDGLSMEGWSQTSNNRTWGTRTVEFTWPPVDGHVSLVSDLEHILPNAEDYVPSDSEREMEEFFTTIPPGCADITNPTTGPTLNNWAKTYPDRAGLMYVVNGGPFGVLGIVGDLEPVRAELVATGTEPCLVSVDYTFEQLETAQQALGEMFNPELGLLSVGRNVFNRVEVAVTVADMASIQLIVDAVDDPGILLITSPVEILE